MGYSTWEDTEMARRAMLELWSASSGARCENFMGARTIFGIDIGTASIKGLVAEVHPRKEALELVAKVEVPSQGVKKGMVFDVDDTARSLGVLLDEVESLLEREIKEVMVTIGGPQLQVRQAKGTVVVSRADEEIGKEDVARAIQAVHAASVPQNRTLLHVIPKSFLIDESDRVRDPIGMQGTRLSAEALLVDIFAQPVKNLQKVLSVVGLTPILMVGSILAGGRATVPKKERDLGVLAIDLGAETTSCAVFEDGDLIQTHIIPLGSQHVTGDLATALKVHFDVAEGIKVSSGHALPGKIPKKEMIPLSAFVEGEDDRISRRYIAEVIEARLTEIFGFVQEELKRLNLHGKLPGGVILFGGGARVPGIEILAKRELKLPARLATLEHYRKLFPEGVEIQFYPACGLLLWMMDQMFGRQKRGSALGVFKNLFKVFLP